MRYSTRQTTTSEDSEDSEDANHPGCRGTLSVVLRWLRRPAIGGLTVLMLMALSPLDAEAKTLKIATTSPDGSSWMKVLRQAGSEVGKATEGRVKIRFYPGGTQGDDFTVWRKMRNGQLHGGLVLTGVFQRVFKDIQVYNLPMVFHDLDEVDAVRAVVDPLLAEGLAEVGFVSFGIAEVGMAYAMSTKEARSLDDARRLRVWLPKGDAPAARTLSAFRVAGIPLSIIDVLSGLQQGSIDTVAVPPIAVLPLSWHTRLKYVLDLPFMYIYSPVVVTESSLRGIGAADRAVLLRIMGDAVAEADRGNRADHAAAWQALGNQGLEFLRPTPGELVEWRAGAQAARQTWIEEKIVSQGMYDKLTTVLAELRSGQAARTLAKPAIAGR